MLFSSRHGLLSWTPVFWAGYLGFVPLLRRRPALAGAFLVPLAVMTYVNACVGDWWGGSSFSNRRFDSLLPLFAFGFAATIEALSSALRRRPDLGLAVLLTPAIVWAFGLEAQVREGRVRDDQVATFASLVGGGARLVSERAGFPTTWPASWVFAWRHRLSPARYDLLVGRYLFYRQNKLGGSIALSADLVDPMLDGFGPVEAVVGVPARCAARAGRFFVPLDEPEPLELRFRAVSVGSAGDGLISVNGRPLGRIPVGSRWTAAALRAPRHLWRRELNEVRLAPEKGAGPLCVETLDLLRTFVRGRRQ
jgi:hypothetical protein